MQTTSYTKINECIATSYKTQNTMKMCIGMSTILQYVYFFHLHANAYFYRIWILYIIFFDVLYCVASFFRNLHTFIVHP